jgi:hypothetical protein
VSYVPIEIPVQTDSNEHSLQYHVDLVAEVDSPEEVFVSHFQVELMDLSHRTPDIEVIQSQSSLLAMMTSLFLISWAITYSHCEASPETQEIESSLISDARTA